MKMAPTDDLLSECLRQLKPSMEEEPEGLSWTNKPLHYMYHSQIEEVADISLKNIPMAEKSWTEGKNRDIDNGCTRTGPKRKVTKHA